MVKTRSKNTDVVEGEVTVGGVALIPGEAYLICGAADLKKSWGFKLAWDVARYSHRLVRRPSHPDYGAYASERDNLAFTVIGHSGFYYIRASSVATDVRQMSERDQCDLVMEREGLPPRGFA